MNNDEPKIEPEVNRATSVENYAEPEPIESDLDTGLQMLENPPNGSFVTGLQAFVAWAKSLMDH